METFNIFKEAKSKIGAKIENTKQYIAEKKANKDNAEESGEFAVNTMSPQNTMSPKDIVIATDDIVPTGDTRAEKTASRNAIILSRILNAFQNYNIGNNIRQKLTNIVDRAEEWNSGAFLVLVVGPVKSGKSTLVNLLANDYVSPTDKLECTNRPTIISAGEKREISTFQSTDKSNIEKDINTIINSIRKGENAPSFVCNKKELSEDGSVIESELFPSGMKREYDPKLLTTITTNKSDFLKKNEDNKQIFLIDMPGFDGKESNTEIDKSHFAIAKRVDLILFVHSSASAFSVASDKFLEEIRKINKNISVFLVHNVYDAAYWLEESEKKKAIEIQVGNEKKEISQYLQLKNDDVEIINLGRVYDYLNNRGKIDTTIKDYSKECAENDLQNLLKKLNKNIKENISDIRISNCLLSTQEQIKALNESIKIEIDRLRMKSKNLQLIKGILDDYPFIDIWEDKKEEIAEMLREKENTRVFDKDIEDAFWARDIQKPLEAILKDYIEKVSENVNQIFLNRYSSSKKSPGNSFKSLKEEFICNLKEIIEKARDEKKNPVNLSENTDNDKVKDEQKEGLFDVIYRGESVLRTVSFKILEDAENGETVLPTSLREEIKSYVKNKSSKNLLRKIDSNNIKTYMKEHFAGIPERTENNQTIKGKDGRLIDYIKGGYDNMRQDYIKQIRDLLLNDECCNQTEEDKKKEETLISLKEILNKFEF